MTSHQSSQNPTLSQVHPNAKIHPTVQIQPFSIINEDVEIGEGTWIGSNVAIYDGVKIGKNCRILPGTVISANSQQLEFWRKDSPATEDFGRVYIGDSVHIEPSANIHGGISIGDGSWIGSSCTIHDGARIGKHCKIFPGAVVSAIPQDLKFHGEKTTLEIGDHTTVREFATLNRGTEVYGKTVIGKHVLIMAYVHVAHDCIIGDHSILVNGVNIAGHVELGEYAFVGGVSAIHQFVKVGKHAFISGGSMVRKDVPPYVKTGRDPVKYEGVNSIGLRRRGFANGTINHIQDIYRHIFLNGLNTAQALDFVETQIPASEERDEILTFIRKATRGIIRGHGSSKESSSDG